MAAAVLKGGRKKRSRRQMAEINVTPFVDVMLVLLIVFMVTAPLLTTGVSVDLPDTRSASLPGQDEPLSVTVAADGRIFLQESAVAIEQLGPRLVAITRENRQARIFIRGDRKVDYGQVMAAVGAINEAGFSKVALVTDSTVRTEAARPVSPPSKAKQP